MTKRRLKHVCAFEAGGTPDTENPLYWADVGGIPWVAIADMTAQPTVATTAKNVTALGAAASRLKSGQPGTVLLAMYASVGATAVLGVPAVWNQAILGLTPGTGLADSRFLRYWLESVRTDWMALVRSNTQDNLNAEVVGNAPFSDMSEAEQRRMADYLDAETAGIDALIRTRSAQTALVQERHVSMLSRLLVPEGVAFGPLKRLAAIQSGLTVDALRDIGDDPVTRPYLRVANVQPGRLELESVTEITVPRGLAERCTLHAGDVLMTEGGDLDKLGRGTVWRDELPGALHQNHIFAVRPLLDRLDPDYLGLLTQTAHARAYFESTGVRTTNLASTNSEKIMSLPVPRLDLGEQRRLVDETRMRLDQMAAFQGCLGSQTDLLLERRQALITAAVTGQIHIPGVAT